MFLAHRSWQEKSSFIFQIKITSLWWGSVRLLSDKLLSYKPKEGMEIKNLVALMMKQLLSMLVSKMNFLKSRKKMEF
jgi:hypothetical protein